MERNCLQDIAMIGIEIVGNFSMTYRQKERDAKL